MYSTTIYRSVTYISVRSLHKDAVALARGPSTAAALRARQYRWKKPPKLPVNPGISKSLEVFGHKSNDEIPEDDLHDLDDLESDFMNLHKLYGAHKQEISSKQEMVQHKMIERKYFKEVKEPKLLTWEEKEQIHYLHKSDPEEWNPKKLSECFPATENTVKKILKSQWRPESVDKILKYNEGVVKNWKLLSEGKLPISEELRQHLSQFTSREKMLLKPPDPGVLPPAVTQQETISREFFNIIDSYQRKSQEPNTNTSKPVLNTSNHRMTGDDDTFFLEDRDRKDWHHVTLEKYAENILKYRRKFDELDKAIVDDYAEKRMKTAELVPEPVSIQVNKFEKKLVEIETIPVPPEKIKIPAHLKGRGSLYKLEDCYYDVDGEFLYRVPGMTN